MSEVLEPEKLATVQALRPLADGLGVSLAQLALRWCLRIPGLASAIVGATRLVQTTLGHQTVATTGRYLHARPKDSSGRYLAI